MIVKHKICKSAWNVNYAVEYAQRTGGLLLHVDETSFPRVLTIFFSKESQLEEYKRLFNAKMHSIITSHQEQIEELERVNHLTFTQAKEYIRELTFSDDSYTAGKAKNIMHAIKDMHSLRLLFIQLSYARFDPSMNEKKEELNNKIVDGIIQAIINGKTE